MFRNGTDESRLAKEDVSLNGEGAPCGPPAWKAKFRVSHTCVRLESSAVGTELSLAAIIWRRSAIPVLAIRNSREREHTPHTSSRVVANCFVATIIWATLSDLVESSARYTHVNGITSFCKHTCIRTQSLRRHAPAFYYTGLAERFLPRGTWTFLGYA